MNRAFIFDMDGVLIDSERAWALYEKPLLERVFGATIVEQIGSTIGVNASQIFEKARSLGSSARFEDLARGYAEIEAQVYARSNITPGADEFIDALALRGYKIGLVTQSPQSSIDLVLPRLSSAAHIERTLALFQHKALRPKPHPDGYIEILREFNAELAHAFIHEDSINGILAGKAAGAFVIGFKGNLVDGYEQEGADAYADTMENVLQIVEATKK